MAIIDRMEVKIKAKIDVPKETAEACVKLLEIWVNADNSRRIEIDSVTTEEGVEQKIYLVEGEWHGDNRVVF